MVTFKKTNDEDFQTYYEVYINGELVDWIGVAYADEAEWYGEGWQNGASEVADIIGGGFDFQSIKQAFRDNEQEIWNATAYTR